MMNREIFISELRKGLRGLKDEEVERLVSYYNENILDRMEDGMSEEEAVESLGDLETIISEARSAETIPEILHSRINEMKNSFKGNTLLLILIIITSPVWITLFMAAAGIVLGIEGALMGLAIAFSAVVTSMLVVAGITILKAVSLIIAGSLTQGALFIAVGLIFAGLFMLLLVPTKAFFNVIKKLILRIIELVKRIIRG